MIGVFRTVVFVFIALSVTGCSEPKQTESIWEGIRIGDVAPSDAGGRDRVRAIKTLNFNIYVFEMPAAKIDVLNEIWKELHTEPFDFADREAFGANLFSVGFGEIVSMWDRVGGLLREAGGKKVETVSLLLFDNKFQDFTVTRLGQEQTVFYLSVVGRMDEVKIGPGEVGLRMKARHLPAGVCALETEPVFISQARRYIRRLAGEEDLDDELFSSCRFELKMKEGDFILLGPGTYSDNQKTLGGLFFSVAAEEPTIRLYLFICTSVID